MRFQICKQLSAWLPSPRIRLAHLERAPRINLQTLAQWVLDFIEKAARRRKELDGKTEIRRLPGGFDDAEDACKRRSKSVAGGGDGVAVEKCGAS